MIETMYAAPGIGLAAPQVGAALRIFIVDLSLGRDSAGLIVMVNPEFVEREGMQLEDEGCLSVPGFNATVVRPARAVVKGLDRGGQRAGARRHRPARPRLSARDGSPRRHALRRSPARHQARPHCQKDSQTHARREMVTANGLRVVFFGTPQFAVPTLDALLASSHHARGRRRHAAGSAPRPRPEY